MKRYCKITTNTPDETTVTGLSEPWILLDKSETGKDNFIFQRSINNLTLDLLEGSDINDVKYFVSKDTTHALMCVKNKDNTYTVIYKKEKTELYPDYPLSIYQSCKNIILPNSINKINPETFKNCIGLENITLPNSISEIGDKVFYGCENLTTIKIPNKVKRISNDLFNGCKNLETVYIPSNIHDISETAFNECEKLTEVILYNGLTNSEEHFPANENGEIFIKYYDENGEQKTIGINTNNNSKPEDWELHALTPNNNTILYKTSSNDQYDFNVQDGNTGTYVEGYTINGDGSHSSSTKLDIVDHSDAKDLDGYYKISFDRNTNISKISGYNALFKTFFYFDSSDLQEIYLPVSVTDINNFVFNTPNLFILLLPPNISLKACKLPDDEENEIYNRYVEVLFNCGKLKNILYNGTSKEFTEIISNPDITSPTWYKDLPHEFTVTCFDKVLQFTNDFKTDEPVKPGETTSDNDDLSGTTSDNVGDSTSDNNDGTSIPGGSEDIGDSTSDNNDGPEGDNIGGSTTNNDNELEGGDDTGNSTTNGGDGPDGDDDTSGSTSSNGDGPDGDDDTGDSTSSNGDGPDGDDDTSGSTSSNGDGPDGFDDVNFNETEYDPNVNEPGTKEYGEGNIVL